MNDRNNSTRTKVRFALIGAGAIAKAHAEAFRDHPDAELVAVVDTRVQAAEDIASKVDKCRVFDRVSALHSPDFDAAIVATPPITHDNIVLELLSMGKHVLCEKPFTITTNSAKKIAQAASDANRVVTMASKFRYTEDVVTAKRMLENHMIGDLILFENAFTSRIDMSRRWNSDPAVSGGGVLIDNGAHSLDIARYFLGPINEMHAIEGRRLQPLAVEDTVHLFLRAGTGQMGSIDLSWSVHKDRESFLDLYGENGTIRVGWKGSWYKTTATKDWVRFGEGYDKNKAFRANLANFSRHIRGEEELQITIDDALANVAAIEASYKSLRRQEWISTKPEAVNV
jgi:predicted dehydrogenase